MKAELFVEYSGKQISKANLEASVKEAWTAAGNKATAIKSLEIYVQPESNVAYYVINDDFKGQIEL